MNIGIIGAGYVGVCTGVGFASKGHRVICMDIDNSKIKKINKREAPIHEKKLQEMMNNVKERFSGTTDIDELVNKSKIIFIAVGTPSKEDGNIDLSYVKQAAKDLGNALKNRDNKAIVVKSTVIPGTTDKVKEIITNTSGKEFPVAMNPEFLREGRALEDFLNPDSIVFGGDEEAIKKLKMVYENFPPSPYITSSARTAEAIKYFKNSYLAKDISFANEMANMCELLGVDYKEIKKALREDKRIGSFLDAGIGFGGSCFPKDVKAIMTEVKEQGYEPRILENTLTINEEQPLRIPSILKEELGEVKGKTIGILGLAFKAGTDDIRESRVIPIIKTLLEEDMIIKAYDPQAMENMKKVFSNINYTTKEDCLKSDAVVILTDWDQFKGLKDPGCLVIDGKRILNPQKYKHYRAIGYPKNYD